MSGLRLGVNIDHVATLRQARYATMPESKNAEPDPIAAASICERAGAGGIVAHLRADRRHIQERDTQRSRACRANCPAAPQPVPNLKIWLSFGQRHSPHLNHFCKPPPASASITVISRSFVRFLI